MTEAKVGFLSKLAAAVSCPGNDVLNTKLKSYYLMRCKEITKGYGLPDKYFAPKVRCPNCCIEWKKDTQTKVRSSKLSKRQRKRLKSNRGNQSDQEFVQKKNILLLSNNLEQICTFCKQSTLTSIPKPHKLKGLHTASTVEDLDTNQPTKVIPKTTNKQPETKSSKPVAKNKQMNVYASTHDVFSLQNQNNSITTKEKPKVINNNKKKKDKFAGLCQKAVLASAKLKEQADKKNKLNLFLKPST